MSNRITVHHNKKPIYDIVLEDSFLSLTEELDSLYVTEKKICIVTDSRVAALYLEEIKELIRPCCKAVVSFVFPEGEAHKNLETVKQLYEVLIRSSFDRKDMLVALGGGVVGDLCGFAAATYLRGVSFIQIPTTLLSQVDSSIGGKTGVDFDSYKNMVGAFHMPKLVYSNTRTLQTLSDEQFSSGMGEVIKHGLIADSVYYEWLTEHQQEIIDRDLVICEQMILKSDRIKRQMVEEDPTEQGTRALLNFGHTIGHAIEKLTNFQLLHGHCVGLGCLAAAYICKNREQLTEEEFQKLTQILKIFGHPTQVQGLETDQIIAATKHDKKMDGGVIQFILLHQIGEAYMDKTVSDHEMMAAISSITNG